MSIVVSLELILDLVEFGFLVLNKDSCLNYYPGEFNSYWRNFLSVLYGKNVFFLGYVLIMIAS